MRLTIPRRSNRWTSCVNAGWLRPAAAASAVSRPGPSVSSPSNTPEALSTKFPPINKLLNNQQSGLFQRCSHRIDAVIRCVHPVTLHHIPMLLGGFRTWRPGPFSNSQHRYCRGRKPGFPSAQPTWLDVGGPQLQLLGLHPRRRQQNLHSYTKYFGPAKFVDATQCWSRASG